MCQVGPSDTYWTLSKTLQSGRQEDRQTDRAPPPQTHKLTLLTLLFVSHTKGKLGWNQSLNCFFVGREEDFNDVMARKRQREKSAFRIVLSFAEEKQER